MENSAYIVGNLNAAIVFIADGQYLFVLNKNNDIDIKQIDGYILSQIITINPEIKEVNYQSIKGLSIQIQAEFSNQEALSMSLEIMDISYSEEYRQGVADILIARMLNDKKLRVFIENRLFATTLPSSFQSEQAFKTLDSRYESLLSIYKDLRVKSNLFSCFYTLFKLELNLDPFEQANVDTELTDNGCYKSFTEALFERSRNKFNKAEFATIPYLLQRNFLDSFLLFDRIENKLYENYQIKLENDVPVIEHTNQDNIKKQFDQNILIEKKQKPFHRIKEDIDSKRISVFIINDDEIDNFITVKLLRKVNTNIDIATFLNGKLAIERLLNITKTDISILPNLIILDINMPIMNGWEFLDEYKRLYLDLLKQVKIYILASSVFSNDINKVENYPFINVISKPMNLETIQQLFETILHV